MHKFFRLLFCSHNKDYLCFNISSYREYTIARDEISKNSNLSSKQKYSKKQKLGEKFITDINAIPYPDRPAKRKSKGIIMGWIFNYRNCYLSNCSRRRIFCYARQWKNTNYAEKNIPIHPSDDISILTPNSLHCSNIIILTPYTLNYIIIWNGASIHIF